MLLHINMKTCQEIAEVYISSRGISLTKQRWCVCVCVCVHLIALFCFVWICCIFYVNILCGTAQPQRIRKKGENGFGQTWSRSGQIRLVYRVNMQVTAMWNRCHVFIFATRNGAYCQTLLLFVAEMLDRTKLLMFKTVCFQELWGNST